MDVLDGGPIRLICHEPGDGPWNMAVDEVLSTSAAAPGGRPAIRLYGFRPPTLSIGRFQPVSDVLRERLREEDVGLVRRPTGGRAVLHAAEVTYAVALGTAHLRPFGKRTVYRFVGDLLLAALTELGVACRRNPAQIGDAADPDCFGAVGEYEVVGRFGKLVGSAQMVTRHGVLQHGSIPLDDTFRRVARYLKAAPAAGSADASWLAKETGRSADFAEVADRLRRSLAAVLAPVEASRLDAAETERATALLAKFSGPSWTLSGVA